MTVDGETDDVRFGITPIASVIRGDGLVLVARPRILILVCQIRFPLGVWADQPSYIPGIFNVTTRLCRREVRFLVPPSIRGDVPVFGFEIFLRIWSIERVPDAIVTLVVQENS